MYINHILKISALFLLLILTLGVAAASDDIDEDIDVDDEDFDEDEDDIDMDDEDFDEDEEDDFDEIAYYTGKYISFYDSKFNDTPENVSYDVKYNAVYSFLNNTSSKYDNDFLDYEYFKEITKFYLKTYKNFTDEDLNVSEDFYKDLYDEFIKFIYSDISSIGSVLGYKEIQPQDNFKRQYPDSNFITITFNQTANVSNKDIQIANHSQSNFTILVVVLILILFIVILERII